MLHSQRKRQQEYAEREAAGESLWTLTFDDRTRTRIMHVFNRAQGRTDTSPHDLFTRAHRLICEAEGKHFLAIQGASPAGDFERYYNVCPDIMFPTVLEALWRAFAALDDEEATFYGFDKDYSGSFASGANEYLAQERVGWEFVDGQMVEVHSKELHVEAVEPAIRLLHRHGFEKADEAYRDALGELAQGNAADAITDAARALQETLTALGYEGDQLGDLIRSAKAKGLIASHDNPLMQAIEKALHWVAADRSQMGDAHKTTQPSREDAWLTIHVVGALIVRFASGERRQ